MASRDRESADPRAKKDLWRLWRSLTENSTYLCNPLAFGGQKCNRYNYGR
jgi:hypothetical protein